MIQIFVVSLFFLFSCTEKNKNYFAHVDLQKNSNVIYGDDGRTEISDAAADLQELARSTVAFIPNEKMVFDSVFNKYNFKSESNYMNFCPTERFKTQPRFADCSGTLIAEDLILTAGHCVSTPKDCKETKIVFDYKMNSFDKTIDSIRAENVYSCQKIMAFKNQKFDTDYAIIQLDRAVTERKPLEFSNTALTYQDTLMLIGHPDGLPTKITLNGKIRSLIEERYFKATLDAFSGNSGSAVFDQSTHKIVGVLVRGEVDYERKNGCMISKVCNENDCRGEDVTRISEVQKALSNH